MNDVEVVVPVWEQKVLTGKNAVITGGTSGIGYATADAFLRADCKNVLITSRSQEKLDAAVNRLKHNHPEKEDGVLGIVLDLENISDFAHSVDEMIGRFCDKKIDIWVNNAGIYKGSSFGNVSEETWDSLMDINLKAQYFLSQLVANHMIENRIKGSILNMCSSSSYRPSIDPYMLSKLGLSGLTTGMAKKLIQHGIVVNGIAPGPTFTPMLHKGEGDSIQHNGVPAGRYILPQEIANLAVFLVSAMGRMIVGDVVRITGGSAVITYDDVRY